MSVKNIIIAEFELQNGRRYQNLNLRYEEWGPHNGPVVLVFHALTGNSSVAEDDGWWSGLIAQGKRVDTNYYRVICFNTPGNGYLEEEPLAHWEDWRIADLSKLFVKGLSLLNIDEVHSLLGGSLGGMIAWQIAIDYPELSEWLIPIASHYQATDWLIAHNTVQTAILNESSDPLAIARMMAMLFYRTPKDFSRKFGREKRDGQFSVESYLIYQGQKLKGRFNLDSYKLMTNLLTNSDATANYTGNALERISAKVFVVGVDTDILLPANLGREVVGRLRELGKNSSFGIINSDYGHDAFLIEFEQLSELLKNIYKGGQNE